MIVNPQSTTEDPQPEIPDTLQLRGEIDEIRAGVDQCEQRQRKIQAKAQTFIDNGNGSVHSARHPGDSSLET